MKFLPQLTLPAPKTCCRPFEIDAGKLSALQVRQVGFGFAVGTTPISWPSMKVVRTIRVGEKTLSSPFAQVRTNWLQVTSPKQELVETSFVECVFDFPQSQTVTFQRRCETCRPVGTELPLTIQDGRTPSDTQPIHAPASQLISLAFLTQSVWCEGPEEQLGLLIRTDTEPAQPPIPPGVIALGDLPLRIESVSIVLDSLLLSTPTVIVVDEVPLAIEGQIAASDVPPLTVPNCVVVSLTFSARSSWCDGSDKRRSPHVRNDAAIVQPPSRPKVKRIRVSIAPPTVRRKMFVPFVSIPMNDAVNAARQEASRQRVPDDDPLSGSFFILLARHNWDVRVNGLDVLLAAYPDGKKPFDFQYEGIKFLAERTNALLGDEMGLGKTVQAILAMRAKIHAGRIQRVLVLCPKSLLANWSFEISTWAPELSVTIAAGPQKLLAIHRPHHVYITNYDAVLSLICNERGKRFAKIRPFDLIIVDEIQNLKNPSTKRARAITRIEANHRWGLTGTFVENRFEEYRAVWNALDPKLKEKDLNDQRFIAKTKVNVLRREKSQVLKDLPKKITRVQYVELDGPQLVRYREEESFAVRDVKSKLDWKEAKLRTHVLATIQRLKQICIIDDKSKTSAKAEWLEELLSEMHPENKPLKKCEKALVFTQYPRLVWDKWCLPKLFASYCPLRYDGSLKDGDRQEFPNRFQNEEESRVAFLGLTVGATGLNLTRASQVVFLDQWWNPAVMDQAGSRIHRIGQKRRCVITTLVAKGTIEERVMAILDRKRQLFERLVREIQSGQKAPGDIENLENALTLAEMLEALGLSRAKRDISSNPAEAIDHSGTATSSE